MTFQALVSSSPDLTVSPVRTALNNGGRVAFAARTGNGVDRLALADGGPVVSFDMSGWGLTSPARVALDDASHVAFLAATPTSNDKFGAFATDANGVTPQVFYAAALGGGIGDGSWLGSESGLALAPNGTLAFSSVRDDEGTAGALYRGPVTGAVAPVVNASGTFAASIEVDVNSAGLIAMQTEGGFECGLRSNIFLYDAPGPTLANLTKAIAGLPDGEQPTLAINDGGAVAFALPGTSPAVEVLRCPTAQPRIEFDLPVGVYAATPTPFSVELPELTPVAEIGAAYQSFGEVDINNAGTVVFEATLVNGNPGIFRGPDPVADKIVAKGDTLGGEVVSDVQLGHLNDACQLSLTTVSASGRRVWRVNGVSRP
jgi:hypothetical protein